jgi:quinol monooxygenase YgiN
MERKAAARPRQKPGYIDALQSVLKELAGALHTDEGGCTFSVSREFKMEIPAQRLILSTEG